MKLITILLLLFILIYVSPVEAFRIGQPENAGVRFETNKDGNAFINDTVASVVQLFYVIGGTAVLIMTVWGATEWVLSGGDKEKVAAARKKITNALIGLALLSLSFVIINVVGTLVGFNPLGNLQLPSFVGIGR
jgi:hypothetical protein